MNKDEEKLVKLYMDLTGAPESCARSVFMIVTSEKRKTPTNCNEFGAKPLLGCDENVSKSLPA